jgi:hypothetical protein
VDDREKFYLTEEMMEWVELKKSEYLSKLIMNVTPDDFPFEVYSQFNHQIPETLEAPDKVFKRKEDGQEVRSYLKTFFQDTSYSQMVIGAVVLDQGGTEIFVPILSFVSRSAELVHLFCEGEVITRPTLN